MTCRIVVAWLTLALVGGLILTIVCRLFGFVITWLTLTLVGRFRVCRFIWTAISWLFRFAVVCWLFVGRFVLSRVDLDAIGNLRAFRFRSRI